MKNFRRVIAACLFGISPNLVAIPSIYRAPLTYARIAWFWPYANKIAEGHLRYTQLNDARNASDSRHLEMDVTVKATHRYLADKKFGIYGLGKSKALEDKLHSIAFFGDLPFFVINVSKYMLPLDKGSQFNENYSYIARQTLPIILGLSAAGSLPHSVNLAAAHGQYYATKTQLKSDPSLVEKMLCKEMNGQVFSSNLIGRVDANGDYIKPASLGKHHKNLQTLRGDLYKPAANGGRTSNVATPEQLVTYGSSVINVVRERGKKTPLPKDAIKNIESFVKYPSPWRPADYDKNPEVAIERHANSLRKNVGTLPDSFYERNPGAQRFDRLWNTQA